MTTIRRVLSPLSVLAVAVFLLAFTGTALAQAGTVGEDGSILDLLRPVLDAFRGHDYDAAGALALVVLVALGRQYGRKLPGAAGRFLGSEPGALALVIVGSFAGAVAAAVTGPAGITLDILGTSAKLAFYAAGGFALVKKYAYPILVALRAKVPGPAQSILDVVLWVLDGGKAAAIAKAESAGAAAVVVKPSTGAAGVIGTPRDVE